MASESHTPFTTEPKASGSHLQLSDILVTDHHEGGVLMGGREREDRGAVVRETLGEWEPNVDLLNQDMLVEVPGTKQLCVCVCVCVHVRVCMRVYVCVCTVN